MAKNPFFNFTQHASEQSLHEDLIIESIKIHGQDFIYLVRENRNLDLLYGEDILNKFETTFEIEMYISTVNSFEGDRDLFTKFGTEVRDSAKLMVAKRRFHREMMGNMERPREGDLIYLPLDGGLFEIHHVEDEEMFYQLGNLPVYTLSIERFEFSHENFETNYEEIDGVTRDFKYSYELQLGAGSGTLENDEIVFQGASYANSTASGTIHSYDSETNKLRLYKIKGEFKKDLPIKVVNSLSTYDVTVAESLDIKQEIIADNKRLEDKGKQIYDFNEKDPYSDGEY